MESISLETQLTRTIRLSTPILSSPMDTVRPEVGWGAQGLTLCAQVTEDRMAIEMALQVLPVLGTIYTTQGMRLCSTRLLVRAQGGLGVIHYNNGIAAARRIVLCWVTSVASGVPAAIEEQAAMVRRVKRFENGFITDPICLRPDNVIADVDVIQKAHGFSGIPITESGRPGSKLLGARATGNAGLFY